MTNFVSTFKKQSETVYVHHRNDDFVLRELVPLSYVLEKNTKWILQVDLPGVERKNIIVTMTNGHLVVKAKLVKAYNVSNHGRVTKFENLKKAMEIPQYADTKKISVKFKDGVLTISIPKIESGKRIPIK